MCSPGCCVFITANQSWSPWNTCDYCRIIWAGSECQLNTFKLKTKARSWLVWVCFCPVLKGYKLLECPFKFFRLIHIQTSSFSAYSTYLSTSTKTLYPSLTDSNVTSLEIWTYTFYCCQHSYRLSNVLNHIRYACVTDCVTTLQEFASV